MRCDDTTVWYENALEEFQSLSGFLMRCDAFQAFQGYVLSVFQSLSGFLMRCDPPRENMATNHPSCFNPYRVF